MNYYTRFDSPLGGIILFSDGTALTGLSFETQKDLPDITRKTSDPNLAVFTYTKDWLEGYFMGKNEKYKMTLKFIGSNFTKQVFDIIKDIPYGETITYKDIGEELLRQNHNKKISYRAIGQAVGRNPIGIIVPCHRVIGTSGALTGYAGGLDKKINLLKIEKIL